MALTCPKCAAIIPTQDINIATDVAVCRACDTMHKAGELVHDDVIDATHVDAAETLRGPPPPGVTWRDDGQTLRLKTSVACKPIGLFLLAFGAFWGLFSLLTMADLVGELINGPPKPVILPDDASEFERTSHEMETMMRSSTALGDWVMGIILTLVSSAFLYGAAIALLARITIRVRPDQGTIAKGLFPFIIRRQFDPARVTAVIEQADSGTKVNGRTPTKIVIKAAEDVAFGGFMTEPRRKWILAILQANLLRRR